MKKTEHVPSTGRPSSREGEPTSCDRPSPPQELPSNPPPPSSSSPPSSSFCQRLPHPLHQSPPGTSASSFNNPAASEPLSCFTQRNAHTRSCVLVSIFTSLSSHLFPPPSPLAPSSCSSCCWVTVRAPIILLNLPNIHTHTQEGRQGIPEGDD